MSNMITKPDGENGKKYKTVSSENKGNNANAQGKTIIEDFESNNQKYLRDCRVLAAYGLGRCEELVVVVLFIYIYQIPIK